jgi:nucleotide-binding universal stress UspA family protein
MEEHEMFKLLVAIDESEQARRILDKVVEIAGVMPGAEIHVLNVQEEPTVYGEVALYLSQERAIQLKMEAGQRVVDAAIELLQQKGVAVKGEVLVGDIAPAIAGCADAMSCNLIVMGTRGMGAVASLVLGSVATKVIHLTRIPILLVH